MPCCLPALRCVALRCPSAAYKPSAHTPAPPRRFPAPLRPPAVLPAGSSSSSSEGITTVYVGNLPGTVDEYLLVCAFAPFGPITHVQVGAAPPAAAAAVHAAAALCMLRVCRASMRGRSAVCCGCGCGCGVGVHAGVHAPFAPLRHHAMIVHHASCRRPLVRMEPPPPLTWPARSSRRRAAGARPHSGVWYLHPLLPCSPLPSPCPSIPCPPLPSPPPQVIKEKGSNVSRGYGFVSYAHPIYATVAMQHMNQQVGAAGGCWWAGGRVGGWVGGLGGGVVVCFRV